MPKFVIRQGAREVVDRKIVVDGVVKQVVSVYHLTSSKAQLVWEWLTGWIFTSNGSAIKTKDGSVIKCNNQ